jgi:lipase chaperone LimK
MRKMLERQLKSLPKDQQEQVMLMMQKDPDLFQKIAEEMQAEMKKGKDQMSAAMIVMPKYQNRLRGLMGNAQK